MPNYIGKVIMNFGKFGAAETYAFTKTTIALALTSLEAIGAARVPMLCDTVQIVGMEVSDVDIRGDALVSQLTPLTGTFNAGTSTGYNPYKAKMYRLTDPTNVHRSLKYVRFLPEDKFSPQGDEIPDLTWDTALTTLEGTINAQCKIPHKIPGAVVPPFYTFFDISTLIEERMVEKKVGRAFFLPVGRR